MAPCVWIWAAISLACAPHVATFAPSASYFAATTASRRSIPAASTPASSSSSSSAAAASFSSCLCCSSDSSPQQRDHPALLGADESRRMLVGGLAAGLWLSSGKLARAVDEPAMNSGLFYAKWPYVQPSDILPYIYATAEKGNVDSILKAMDDFGTYYPMYKLGEEKGAILERQLDMLPRKPKIAVELGCFLGYSALRTARHLADGGQMYCFEYNPMHAEVAKKVVEYGGLGDRVTFVVGVSTQKLPSMASKCKGADFVLLDHAKDIYLSDLKLMEKLGMVQKGCMVAADNVVYPGAPGYLEYVGGASYQTQMVEAKFEYDQKWRQGWTSKQDALSFSLKVT